MKLSLAEQDVIRGSPEGLQILIDWHERQANMADGMDMADAVHFHNERKRQLVKLQVEIESKRRE